MMTNLTFAVGAALSVLGVVAYFATEADSATALIPTFIGVLFLAVGAIAKKANAHRHAIHAALLLAVIGALGSLMNVAKLGDLFAGTAERPGAVVSSTIMFVVLLAYIVVGVRSFITAKRYRTGQAA